jgi:hypothetical protein
LAAELPPGSLRAGIMRGQGISMSMTQLVIGTACGFLVAQALLFGTRALLEWLQRGAVLPRIRALFPKARLPTLEPAAVAAFIKYAAPVAVGVALLTFGVWAVGDYFAAKSARTAAADALDPAPAASLSESTPGPQRTAAGSAALPHASAPETAEEEPARAVNPYADPDFKVQHRPPHRGGAHSLKETLVQRSEARARGELLRELHQHVHRSQYDCEAAERADRYLKAGLDVWGFASWQVKYFPADSYRGATLEQCKDIKAVVASSVDLQSAVAQQHQDDSER